MNIDQMRKDFEARLPVPDGAIFNGSNYEAATALDVLRVIYYQAKWEAWQARGVLNGFSELRRANNARQIEWDNGTEATLSYKGNELAGETGELCNVLKKLEREARGMVGSRATVEQAAEEAADVVICVDLIASKLGFDLFDAIVNKFNKTSEKNGLRERMLAVAPEVK